MEGHNHRRHAGVVCHGEEEPGRAGQQRDPGPQGDQRVHVGVFVAHGRPRAAIGWPADPEEHRQGQHDHPQVVDGGIRPDDAEEHFSEHPEDDGDGEAPGHGHAEAGIGHLALFLVDLFARIPGFKLQNLIAGVGDGFFEVGQRSRAGDIGHGGSLGSQVDRGLEHAGHFVERFFDMSHARGTGHPSDRQVDCLRGNVVT